jgi:hypothetical protein
MSILQKMITEHRNKIRVEHADKIMVKNERLETSAYINDLLTSRFRNCYYQDSGNYDVYLQTPQRYDVVKYKFTYLEANSILTYTINFSSQEKAEQFLKNNFYMGVDKQKNVKIGIVNMPVCSMVVIQPMSIDYEVHIEVDNEEVAQKLVKRFRQQYLNNKNIKEIKEKKHKISKDAEKEIENLGIEF